MSEGFEKDLLRDMIGRGDLRGAMAYLARFPETGELHRRAVSLYREERYLAYGVEEELNALLLAYQKYYRDAFYLEFSPERAEGRLRERLAGLLRLPPDTPLDALEEEVADAFRQRSYHALMGLTSGYRGPYIWKTEEVEHYRVELPEGERDYAVKFLDGFLSKSWLDYLSFGEAGTGGWSNGDGLIHCVKGSYDLDSENFRVSLLKHEAQHAADQEKYGGISSGDLEYRAKLVELIYSSRRRLLGRFLGQADAARTSDGHALAAARIAEGFQRRLNKAPGELAALPVEEVQAAARALFAESTLEMEQKYH